MAGASIWSIAISGGLSKRSTTAGQDVSPRTSRSVTQPGSPRRSTRAKFIPAACCKMTAGTLADLKALTSPYPPALRRALVAGLWEARFSLDAAAKSVVRGDVHHVAGPAFRAVACTVQAACSV